MEVHPEDQYPHKELTELLINAAMSVHNSLKNGLKENIYENAVCVELLHLNIQYNQQKAFPVHYREKLVGKLIPDLIAENAVIVDAKCVEAISAEHISQMLGYLTITGLEIGLIINFNHRSLEVKRIAKLKNYIPPKLQS